MKTDNENADLRNVGLLHFPRYSKTRCILSILLPQNLLIMRELYFSKIAVL